MPHCIIEYAKTLESQVTPNTLINAVYQGALQTELFNPNAIKLRAIAYDHHQTGDQQEEFVHVTVRILSGRTVQQRTLLSDKVLNELAKIGLSMVSLTVEVVSMEKESYTKTVS